VIGTESGRPGHPLADSEGEGTVRTESRAPIIYLSEARSDLLSKVAAAGGRVILVTDGLSRLTEPFREALRRTGGKWVVRSGDGTLRDGRTGRRLERFQDAVTAEPISGIGDVAVAFLRPESPEELQLVVSLSTRHRPDSDTRLGGPIELLALRASRETPEGWGTTEPAGRAWDRAAITDFARARMPRETRLIVTGSSRFPLIATVSARRTAKGVEELTTGLVAAGAPGSGRANDVLAAVPGYLTELAGTSMPLFGLVLARPGRRDLTHPPVLQAPPLPVAMLIGAPGVRELGLDPADALARFGAVIVGRPRIPALLFPLGTAADVSGLELLRDVLEYLGRDRLLRSLGADATALLGEADAK
jgi:hypothetical protein